MSKLYKLVANCSEQIANQNTNITAEVYKVARKRTSGLTVINKVVFLILAWLHFEGTFTDFLFSLLRWSPGYGPYLLPLSLPTSQTGYWISQIKMNSDRMYYFSINTAVCKNFEPPTNIYQYTHKDELLVYCNITTARLWTLHYFGDAIVQLSLSIVQPASWSTWRTTN